MPKIFHRSLAKPKNYGKDHTKRHKESPEPVNRAARRAAKSIAAKRKK